MELQYLEGSCKSNTLNLACQHDFTACDFIVFVKQYLLFMIKQKKSQIAKNTLNFEEREQKSSKSYNVWRLNT